MFGFGFSSRLVCITVLAVIEKRRDFSLRPIYGTKVRKLLTVKRVYRQCLFTPEINPDHDS